MRTNPLQAIAAKPPDFDEATIRQLLATKYDVTGDLTALVSERDQNTRVETGDGRRFVLKIANAAEDPGVTDFQIQALMHLRRKACQVTTPAVIATTAGDLQVEITGSSGCHIARLVTYVDGVMLRDIPLTNDIAWRLGERLAQLGNSLCDFEHPGDRQVLLWDMQRALQLRPLLQHIEAADVRQATGTVLDDFEQRALPLFPQLRTQVIHGDANPDNVLVDVEAANVVGIIDFGDMLRAPLIVDVAVAASYLRVFEDDALRFILPFIAGYHSVSPLDETELGMLFDLIRTRLATTVSFLHWRLAARSEDDAYRRGALIRESGAQVFLSRLDDIGKKSFNERLYDAI